MIRSDEVTDEQKIPIALLPKFTAFLSFLGSAWIMAEVLTGKDMETRKSKLSHPYHRLLLGMSFLDTVESIANFFSTWAVPPESGAWQASGNQMTCNFQGFFITSSAGVPPYNAALSIYYVLIINYNWPIRKIGKRFEPIMHVFCMTWAFGTATAALFLGLLNPTGPWCWIAPFPSDCLDSRRHPEEANCERGDNAWIYRWAFFYAMLWTCLLLTTICTLMVARKVYTIDQASLKYRRPEVEISESIQRGNNSGSMSFQQGGGSSHMMSLDEAPVDEDESASGFLNSLTGSFTRAASLRLSGIRRSRKKFAENNARTMEIFKQAVWYVLAFYLCYGWGFVSRVLIQTMGHTYYWIMLGHAFFDPLQGFLNFFIYQRPRYLKERRDHPHLTRWQTFLNILRLTKFGPPPSRSQASSLSNSSKITGGLVTVRPSNESGNTVSSLSQTGTARRLSSRQSSTDLGAVAESIVECDEGEEPVVPMTDVIESDAAGEAAKPNPDDVDCDMAEDAPAETDAGSTLTPAAQEQATELSSAEQPEQAPAAMTAAKTPDTTAIGQETMQEGAVVSVDDKNPGEEGQALSSTQAGHAGGGAETHEEGAVDLIHEE